MPVPVKQRGFVVLERRWIVERTFAWLSQYRRVSNDDEATTASSEAMIMIAMIGPSSRTCVTFSDRL